MGTEKKKQQISNTSICHNIHDRDVSYSQFERDYFL